MKQRKFLIDPLSIVLLATLSVLACSSSEQHSLPSPSPSATPSPANTPTSSPNPQAVRDAAIWPFSSDSPWNMPLALSASYAPSTAGCTQDLRSVPLALNAREWSHPVYRASSSDPEVGIYLDLQLGRTPTLERTIHVPRDATPSLPPFDGNCFSTALSSSSDAHLHIMDPKGEYVDEMWKAFRKQDQSFKACAYTRVDLKGTGIAQGGARAYGGSALGGLIRKGELRDGIRHALAFAISPSKQRCCDPVWPATAVDSHAANTYRGNIPMGQLIALPPDLDLASLHLSPQAFAVAQALQDYGAYDVDSTGTPEMVFYVETQAAEELDSNLESELQKLRPHLKCITNNRADNVGGGDKNAQRRAPLAPPLR